MTEPSVLSSVADGVATVTLNRPAVHNAFDDVLIADLTAVLRRFGDDAAVRCVVLGANGKTFSAGADLAWMQRMARYDRDDNLADARAMAELMHTLDGLPKPTVALVQGSAYGGGVGLVACCDIALAAERARFSLSEVKLGLIPAVIGPYLVAAIGRRAARRYVLSAETFDAATARRLGLVHEVVPAERLEATGERIVAELGAGGPLAQAAAKALIADVVDQRPGDVLGLTAQRIANIRASDEGQEGLAAFLEKRKPAWIDDGS